ncbi:IS30 family transposase [Haloferula luteola]|uniref:IS30 family transposase n=1 Tax=Haloferula luteola TaxID=595692 RepID=A0A840V1F7_9BACT|nr:IS30 family transposase [Haloferula luteola]
MKNYQQLSNDERYPIGAMRRVKFSLRAIARELGRSPSTISREIRRNAYPTNGRYKPLHACQMARGRRRRARQGTCFSGYVWEIVRSLLRRKLSPMQVSGVLKRFRIVSISHETIYQHAWDDRRYGGDLHTNLRQASKKRRKRYGQYDSRGRLAGKRPIAPRPIGAENRSRLGHWEMDTVLGSGKACILTLVERKTGYLQIAKLTARTKEEVFKAMMLLTHRHRRRYLTITADNGCEFHGDREIEEELSMRFYFAPPHHSWERGTNENTNGLIPAVSSQGHEHGEAHPGTMRLDRHRTERTSARAL